MLYRLVTKIPPMPLPCLYHSTLRWLVVRAHVRQVTGLSACVTGLGLTLVVDAVVEDHEGSSYAVKDLPLAMARGPHLWRWWLQLPEGDNLRRLLALLWPQYIEMGSASLISRRLATLVQQGAPGDSAKAATIGECHNNQVKYRLQAALPAPGACIKNLANLLKAARLLDLAKALDDVPYLGIEHPLFAGVPGGDRREVTEAFFMKALHKVRGPLVAPLTEDSHGPV